MLKAVSTIAAEITTDEIASTLQDIELSMPSHLADMFVKKSPSLAAQNRKHLSGSYRGVTHIKKGNRWRARIRFRGRTANLGFFASAEEAAQAYDAAALRIWGTDAALNFPQKEKNK